MLLQVTREVKSWIFHTCQLSEETGGRRQCVNGKAIACNKIQQGTHIRFVQAGIGVFGNKVEFKLIIGIRIRINGLSQVPDTVLRYIHVKG